MREYGMAWPAEEAKKMEGPMYISGSLGETQLAQKYPSEMLMRLALGVKLGMQIDGLGPMEDAYVKTESLKAPSAESMPMPGFLGRNVGDKRDTASTALSKTEASPAALHPSLQDDEIRTVMMRNIPCRCTKEDLFAAIEELGFAGAYDFFHLPIKRCQRQNYGYAFIGFSTAEVTKAFCAKAEGYRFRGRKSAKAVTLVPARLQSLDEITEHFKDTKVLKSHCPPVFNFINGSSDGDATGDGGESQSSGSHERF
jgi:hypothetical protein